MLVIPSSYLVGCTQANLGMTPGDVLSTVILAGEAMGTHGSTGSSAPSTTRARIPDSRAASARAARVLSSADQYVGVKYTWGGNTPQTGFDCSGFTKFVFAKQGIDLPRTSRDQAKVGTAVARDFSQMVPGDLMFFAEPGEGISHVAIYAGNGEIIHSSEGYGGVNRLDLNTGRGDWYVQNLVAVRRVM